MGVIMLRRYAIGVIVFLTAGALFSSTANFKGYSFEANVIKSSGKRYKEFAENNRITLKVRPNEEYSIVVRNPLPVRAAVAVTIDGLNSIDGKRTTARSSRKWMVEPHSSITIAGWQTSKQTLRKFLFTEQPESFAQWREEKDGKAFTRNLGVIGVAWFWNSAELDAALHPPQPFIEDKDVSTTAKRSEAAPSSAPSASRGKAAAAADESRAGTGMGKEQKNRVTEVAFEENTGMYSVKDVLKIFYEFAKEPPEPQPFIDDEEDEGRFTPDMHK